MKALVVGCSQRISRTGTAVSTTHPSAAMPIHRSSRPPKLRRLGLLACLPASALRLLRIDTTRGDDLHVFERRIVITLAASGLDGRDRVDHLHALRHAAEDGVTVGAG